jgi:transposase InsO family protein
MDLIFIENPHHNNNSRYGLAVIDVFTKKAAIVLLQKKDQPSILEAVKTAFERMGIPETVYADEGSEFISAGFKNYLNENGVTLIITYSHAPFIERFNRTIKEMMDKYLQSKETKDIASVLDKLVDNYNDSKHSVIGMAPNQVNEDNMHIAQMNIIKHAKRNYKPPIYVGMSVRVKLKTRY